MNVAVAVLSGSGHQRTRTGLRWAWAHLFAAVTCVVVLRLAGHVDMVAGYFSVVHAMSVLGMLPVAGLGSRIRVPTAGHAYILDRRGRAGAPVAASWSSSDTPGGIYATASGMADRASCPRWAGAAVGQSSEPYFVASLATTRSWLRAVLCYDPRLSCWALYAPDRAHRQLIQGPVNPLLRDSADSLAARQWAGAHFDHVAAATTPPVPEGAEPQMSRVTGWQLLDLGGRCCWAPLFTDTPRCRPPFAGTVDIASDCPAYASPPPHDDIPPPRTTRAGR